MQNLYSIGEIASVFDETTETFRHYDRVGLLKPHLVKGNGYRYYSLDQFEMISTILHLRSIGTSIDRIKEILGSEGRQEIIKELRHQKQQLRRQIERLTYLEYQASVVLDRFENFEHMKVILSDEPSFFILEQNFADSMLSIDSTQLASLHDKVGSEWIKYGNIISVIDQQDLQNRVYHTYSSYGILSELPCPTPNEYYHTIDAGLYVTGYVRIETYEHSEIDALYDSMLNYIQTHHLQIRGNAFERNLLDLYNDSSDGDIHYIKAYISVSH